MFPEVPLLLNAEKAAPDLVILAEVRFIPNPPPPPAPPNSKTPPFEDDPRLAEKLPEFVESWETVDPPRLFPLPVVSVRLC